MNEWIPLMRRARDIRTELLPFGPHDIPLKCFTDEENAALQAAVARALREADELEAQAQKMRGWITDVYG